MRTASGTRTDPDRTDGNRRGRNWKPLIFALLASVLAHLGLLAGGNRVFLNARLAPPLTGKLQMAAPQENHRVAANAAESLPAVTAASSPRNDPAGTGRRGKITKPVAVPSQKPAADSQTLPQVDEPVLREFRIAIARSLKGAAREPWRAAPARVELVVSVAPGLPARVSVARSSGNQVADREAERLVRVALIEVRPPEALVGISFRLPLIIELGEPSEP